VVRGGRKKLRKYLISAGIIAAVLVCAPIASAGGPNGGWGKGLLSEALPFESYATDAEGCMYWGLSSDSNDVIYDFHGYYLDEGIVYYLICFEGAGDEEPVDITVLGSASVDMCLEDASGVHIKGVMDSSTMIGATVCLVPDSWAVGSGPWTQDEYLISSGTVDFD